MRKALIILIFSNIFFNVSAGLLGPIYAVFVLNIGGNAVDAGIAWSIYSVIVGVLYIIFGRFEDRLNQRKTFVIGRFLDLVGVTGYLFVSNVFQLFLVQAILGIGAATKDPPFNAIFSRSLSKGKETSQWSYQLGLGSIGYGLAAITGGVIATFFGFRTLFFSMVASTSLAFIVSSMIMRKTVWQELFSEVKKGVSV